MSGVDIRSNVVEVKQDYNEQIAMKMCAWNILEWCEGSIDPYPNHQQKC